VNTADYAMILRIPGVGRGSALKIIQARKFGKLYEHHLKKIGIAFNRAKYFMRYADSTRNWGDLQMASVKSSILATGTSKYLPKTPNNQLSLFA